MAKITVKLNKFDWHRFNNIIKMTGLRRDSYLNMVIPGELELLSELQPSAEEGKNYIRHSLTSPLGTEAQVSLNLDKDVIDKLNETCASKRVPRDSFLTAMIKYLNVRLIEPAIVIKYPRKAESLSMSQVLLKNLGVDEEIRDQILSPDFYRSALIWDKARIDEWEKSLQDLDKLFGEIGND